MKALSRTFRTSSGDDKVVGNQHAAASSLGDGQVASSDRSSLSGSSRSSSGSSSDPSNGSSSKGNRSSFSSLTSLGSSAIRSFSGASSKCMPEDEEEEAIMNYLQNSPVPDNPIDFISAAYAPLFNTTAALPKHMQGRYKCKKKRNVPFDMVKEYHVPRYFDSGFTYEHNGEKKDLDGLLFVAEDFHNSETMRNLRTIERAAVIDKRVRHSMQRASVFFHDESIHHPKDGNDEPVHMHIYSIVTVDKGKIVHDHIVVDQSVLANRHADLGCCVQ